MALGGWRLMRLASLFVALLLFWLALSGHYTPFLVAIGVATSLAGVLVADRMGVADAEGHPIGFLAGAVTYWPWLIWEIVKSAWSVTKIIVDPDLPISPTMTITSVRGSASKSLAISGNGVPTRRSPPTPTHVVWPRPAAVRRDTIS